MFFSSLIPQAFRGYPHRDKKKCISRTSFSHCFQSHKPSPLPLHLQLFSALLRSIPQDWDQSRLWRVQRELQIFPKRLLMHSFVFTSISRDGWNATCDSFQLSHECLKAIDSSTSTTWRPAGDASPQHWIVIDLTKSQPVGNVTINGNIVQHTFFAQVRFPRFYKILRLPSAVKMERRGVTLLQSVLTRAAMVSRPQSLPQPWLDTLILLPLKWLQSQMCILTPAALPYRLQIQPSTGLEALQSTSPWSL